MQFTGEFPQIFNKATIISIYKSGDNHLNIYIPILLINRINQLQKSSLKVDLLKKTKTKIKL